MFLAIFLGNSLFFIKMAAKVAKKGGIAAEVAITSAKNDKGTHPVGHVPLLYGVPCTRRVLIENVAVVLDIGVLLE